MSVSSDGSVTLGMRCELLASTTGNVGGLRASLKRVGEVAYIGTVHSLPAGEWIGVRLDQPLGRNNGCVSGVQYFASAPLHGAFVRRNKLQLVTATDGVAADATDAERVEHALLTRRQAHTDALQHARQQRFTANEPRVDELAQRFWQHFTANERSVREQLSAFVDQQQQPTLRDPVRAVQLDALVLQINAMRDDAAAAATLFLSAYDIRQAQRLVAALLERVEATRVTFAPRKKFRFKARRDTKCGTNGDISDGISGGISGGDISGGTKPIASTKTSINSSSTSNDKPNALATATNTTNQQQPASHASNTTATPTATTDYDELVYANLANEVLVIDDRSFAGDARERRDLSFSHLRDCVVVVCVATSAIRCDDLQRCIILTGPVWGSVWLERCNMCDVVVASRQLRVHASVGSTFHLRIASHPIIEGCERLLFGPYRLHYPALNDQLERAGLLRDSGLWAKVNDFQWLRAQQSPNWRVRDPAQPLPVLPAVLADKVSLY